MEFFGIRLGVSTKILKMDHLTLGFQFDVVNLATFLKDLCHSSDVHKALHFFKCKLYTVDFIKYDLTMRLKKK